MSLFGSPELDQASRRDDRGQQPRPSGDPPLGPVPLPVREPVGDQDDVGAIAALPQLAGDRGRAALALGRPGWSRGEIESLARMGPAPSYDALDTVMAAFTPAQLRTVTSIAAGWPDLIALAGLAWSGADVANLAGVAPRPTVADLTTVARFFTVAQTATVMGICAGWADAVALAGLGWTAADLVELIDQDERPTPQQVRTIASRFTHDQVFDVVGAAVDGFTWPDLEALATAAAPGAASPTAVLHAALTAMLPLVGEDVAELGRNGIVVDQRRFVSFLIGMDGLGDLEDYVVRDYLSDARWYSICFATAHRLLADLGGTARYASGDGDAPQTTYPLATQQQRSAQLIRDLTAAGQAGTPVVFEVHVGGHGFTLTVRGQQVFQLEAFASQAGRPDEDPRVLAAGDDMGSSLLQSIVSNRSYGLAEVTTAIGQMTNGDPQQRVAGAGTMGWNAGPCGFIGAGGVSDPMAIWWRSRDLLTESGIVVNVARRIYTLRASLRRRLGLADRT